jgi:hypothetical protein
MSKALKKIYLAYLLPSIFGFALAGWVKAHDVIEIGSGNVMTIVGPLVFILSVVLTIAFPIFYRTLFAHRCRDLIRISDRELLHFERTLINVVMITPYLAVAAIFLELPRFYTAGSILMGLYAVYYFYPSTKRIAFERRIFRVK